MRMRTCVSVVVCVAGKLRPCPSYSGVQLIEGIGLSVGTYC